MENITRCFGEGGWSLAIKMDGKKVYELLNQLCSTSLLIILFIGRRISLLKGITTIVGIRQPFQEINDVAVFL